MRALEVCTLTITCTELKFGKLMGYQQPVFSIYLNLRKLSVHMHMDNAMPFGMHAFRRGYYPVQHNIEIYAPQLMRCPIVAGRLVCKPNQNFI